MDLLKRSEKGSALTHNEMDQNLTDIENAHNGLEARVDTSLNADGSLRLNPVEYAATLVGTDSYAVTLAGTYATLADLAGKVILVKIDEPNTGPATLNPNSLGATAIYRLGGVALGSGDLKAGIAALTYYTGGTPYFALLNPGCNSRANYFTTSNSSNDYTAAAGDLDTVATEVPAAYYAGYRIFVKFNAACTGATRIKVTASNPVIDLGFADVKKNGSSAIESGDFQTDRIYEFVHDGTNFQLVSPIYSQQQQITARYTSTGIAIPTSDGVLGTALTHSLGGVPSEVSIRLVNKGNASGVAHGYAVGDRLVTQAVYSSSAEVDRFLPFYDDTEIDIICRTSFAGAGVIVKKDASGTAAITGSQLAQDFDLEVYAVRYA